MTTKRITGILPPPVQSDAQELLNDFQWDDFAIVGIGCSWTFPSSHIFTGDQFQNAMLAYKKAVEYAIRELAL